MIAIKKASLIHPVGFDRNDQGWTTLISGTGLYLEAKVTTFGVGDIHIYKNTNVASDTNPTWQWYGAVPAANIKSYELLNPPAAPESVVAQSQTQNQAAIRPAAATSK